MTPLRQRLLEDMRIRNLARNTQETYLLPIYCTQSCALFAEFSSTPSA
jgi:hypothetical protein